MLLYWSSDPDGTQHSQRDSVNELIPEINGPNSILAIKVADEDLAAIMETLKELGLDARPTFSSRPTMASARLEAEQDELFGEAEVRDACRKDNCHRDCWRSTSPRRSASRCMSLRRRGPEIDYRAGKHPRRASAILGKDAAKPDIVVGVNGGNDLIYFPQGNAKDLAPKVVKVLLAQDYTVGIFVQDDLGPFPVAATEHGRTERQRAHTDAAIM